MKGLHLLAMLSIAVVLRLLGGVAPGLVESAYSRGVYPWIESLVGWLTGAFSMPLVEPLALALIVAAIAYLGLKIHRRRWRVGRTILDVLGLGTGLYLAFLLLWGLNYERKPLYVQTGFEDRLPSRHELESIGSTLVTLSNDLRGAVGEDAKGAFRLEGGLEGALHRAAAGFSHASATLDWLPTAPPLPKAALASGLLSRLGISGIYSPFTAEPLVNAELPDPDVPFTACHEMAHGLGFAREDEANYVASLACRLHPDADFRYSGALTSSIYVLAALGSADAGAAEHLHSLRSDGTKRDIEALRRFSLRHQGRMSRVSRKVNDAYLKSHNQPEGIERYGRFVNLLAAEQRRNGRLIGSVD